MSTQIAIHSVKSVTYSESRKLKTADGVEFYTTDITVTDDKGSETVLTMYSDFPVEVAT